MSEGECVKVVVRCRPANAREKALNSQKIVKIDRRTLAVSLVKGSEEPKTFTYDNVYDDDSRQKDVYDETAYPLVKSVMEGYNGTIFAYGQTGCGKSFTMEGKREGPSQPDDMRGIIPRTFDQIFEAINTDKEGGKKKFLVAISYVEIYNEEVRDLLSDNPKGKMDVKEDPEKGVFIKGLAQPEVTSVAQIDALMLKGNSQRSIGATAMNATSSRSHSLFTVRIETSTKVDGSDEEHIKAGKLNLVDLAGSERQSKTEATGDRLKEAQKINLSLSALGNVISALVVASGPKGGKDVHIPYRDSKLTRLLQDSLGGNTKTIMIAAISPAADNYDETLSTLRYANRAKNIKNKPKVNEDPKDAMLREFQDEIKRLKELLEGKKAKKAAAGEPDSEEEEEDEEPRPRKVKKVRKPRADGEGDEEVEEEVEEEDRPRRKAKGLMSAAEQVKFEEERADLQAEMARIKEEKEKHESFARLLEEQMRNEKAALMDQMKAQTEAEKAAALQEIVERHARDKEEHEARAAELAAEMARSKEEERQREAAVAEQMQALQSKAATDQAALKAKLKKLQQKMLEGGAQAKSLAQQAEEKARQALEEAAAVRAAEAAEREERLRVEEEKLLLEENYESIKDEVVGKTKKLKKLKKRYLQTLGELDDARAEFARDKEQLLQAVREQYKEMKLYKLIASSVLTKSDLEKIVRGSSWSEEKDTWQLPRIELPVFFPTVRLMPGSQAAKEAVAATKVPPAAASAGRGAAGGSSGVSMHLNAAAKFQEEKGTDSGWKKSAVAGYDRDEYQANTRANISRAVAQQPPAGSPPARSAITTPTGPATHAPPRLDSLHGGGGGDHSREPTNRPAFNPAATSAALGQSADGGDPLDAASGIGRKAAFNPAGSPTAGGGSSAADNVLDTLARHDPAKRAAFAPGAAPAAANPLGLSMEDPLASAVDVPKRANFEPARANFGGALGAASVPSNTPQTSLPSNLPEARSFQPAPILSSAPAADPSAGVPARAAFKPGSSPMDAGGPLSPQNDPLANAPPARAAFNPGPALGGGAAPALPSSLPSRPAFTPAQAPLPNFPDTRQNVFKPAKPLGLAS